MSRAEKTVNVHVAGEFENVRHHSEQAYAVLLRQCDSPRSLLLGRQLHLQICGAGLGHDVYLSNLLIQMYGKCGGVDEAHSLFNGMPNRNIFTYNILIAAFVRSDLLHNAKRVFDEMPERDATSWNELIAAYAQRGQLARAREFLELMPVPNVIAWNSMVTAYFQQNQIQQAKSVFDSMLERDVVSWNCMLTAYAQKGHMSQAEALYWKMPEHNLVTWNMMLAAYSRAKMVDSARSLFDRMCQRNLVSWNTIIGVYAWNDQLPEARRMFERIQVRNAATWNSMLKAYVESDQCDEALEFFLEMDVLPDQITFTTLIAACTSLTNLLQGRLVHSSVIQNGFMSNTIVSNALISMYSSCGKLDHATQLFLEMPEHSIVSWTEMIAAFAKKGRGSLSRFFFSRMISEGVAPTESTFVSILTACSHGGLIEDACYYFQVQAEACGTAPSEVHWMCVVDVLGRAGQLARAEDFIKQTASNQPEAWKTLLAACKVHGDSQLAKRAAQHVVEKGLDTGSSYVLLSHAFNKS